MHIAEEIGLIPKQPPHRYVHFFPDCMFIQPDRTFCVYNNILCIILPLGSTSPAVTSDDVEVTMKTSGGKMVCSPETY